MLSVKCIVKAVWYVIAFKVFNALFLDVFTQKLKVIRCQTKEQTKMSKSPVKKVNNSLEYI